MASYRDQRRPWPVMVERFDELIRKYQARALHDGTGLGDVVADMLEEPAEAFEMVGRERKVLLSEYINWCRARNSASADPAYRGGVSL